MSDGLNVKIVTKPFLSKRVWRYLTRQTRECTLLFMIHAFRAIHVNSASELTSGQDSVAFAFPSLGHTNVEIGLSGCYDESG
ncbi:hypothetical protein Moror_5570, partial [Moniliophthora roreri MCA 2997]